jgi:transcriptional regulatory protein GAL4
VEKRLKYLEKLVADKLPDVDTEDAPPLEGSSNPNAKQESLTGAGESAGSRLGDASFSGEHPNQFSASKNDESILDAVPDEADGLDWQEEANELVDGMASLSVEPTGAGYLGT